MEQTWLGFIPPKSNNDRDSLLRGQLLLFPFQNYTYPFVKAHLQKKNGSCQLSILESEWNKINGQRDTGWALSVIIDRDLIQQSGNNPWVIYLDNNPKNLLTVKCDERKVPRDTSVNIDELSTKLKSSQSWLDLTKCCRWVSPALKSLPGNATRIDVFLLQNQLQQNFNFYINPWVLELNLYGVEEGFNQNLLNLLSVAKEENRILFVVPELHKATSASLHFLNKIAEKTDDNDTVARRLFLASQTTSEPPWQPRWLPFQALRVLLAHQPGSWLGVEGFGTGEIKIVSSWKKPEVIATLEDWLLDYWHGAAGITHCDQTKWQAAIPAPHRSTWYPKDHVDDRGLCGSLMSSSSASDESDSVIQWARDALREMIPEADHDPQSKVTSKVTSDEALHLFGFRHLGCFGRFTLDVPIRVLVEWESEKAPPSNKEDYWYVVLGQHGQLGWRDLLISLASSCTQSSKEFEEADTTWWLDGWYRALINRPATTRLGWKAPVTGALLGFPGRLGASDFKLGVKPQLGMSIKQMVF